MHVEALLLAFPIGKLCAQGGLQTAYHWDTRGRSYHRSEAAYVDLPPSCHQTTAVELCMSRPRLQCLGIEASTSREGIYTVDCPPAASVDSFLSGQWLLSLSHPARKLPFSFLPRQPRTTVGARQSAIVVIAVEDQSYNRSLLGFGLASSALCIQLRIVAPRAESRTRAADNVGVTVAVLILKKTTRRSSDGTSLAQLVSSDGIAARAGLD